jgi:hypothetical protein
MLRYSFTEECNACFIEEALLLSQISEFLWLPFILQQELPPYENDLTLWRIKLNAGRPGHPRSILNISITVRLVEVHWKVVLFSDKDQFGFEDVWVCFFKFNIAVLKFIAVVVTPFGLSKTTFPLIFLQPRGHAAALSIKFLHDVTTARHFKSFS